MKTRVELDPEVVDFVRSLAPEPRRRLREGLRGLAEEKGDLKQLEADLAGYARLRVGGYRVTSYASLPSGANVSRAVSMRSAVRWCMSCFRRFCTARDERGGGCPNLAQSIAAIAGTLKCCHGRVFSLPSYPKRSNSPITPKPHELRT